MSYEAKSNNYNHPWGGKGLSDLFPRRRMDTSSISAAAGVCKLSRQLLLEYDSLSQKRENIMLQLISDIPLLSMELEGKLDLSSVVCDRIDPDRMMWSKAIELGNMLISIGRFLEGNYYFDSRCGIWKLNEGYLIFGDSSYVPYKGIRVVAHTLELALGCEFAGDIELGLPRQELEQRVVYLLSFRNKSIGKAAEEVHEMVFDSEKVLGVVESIVRKWEQARYGIVTLSFGSVSGYDFKREADIELGVIVCYEGERGVILKSFLTLHLNGGVTFCCEPIEIKKLRILSLENLNREIEAVGRE